MKISFVIPAYNEEAILAQCVQSILDEIERTRPLFPELQTEVVVVNNASTDNTKEVAQALGVRVVDEPVKGLVSARNAGFLSTDGDIVANIDADVVLLEGWLTKIVTRFEADPMLVALSGPFIYYDMSAWTRALVKIFYAIGLLTHFLFKNTLAMLQGGNFVIRRAAMLQAGGFDTSVVFYGEDTDVAKRLSKIGKVVWTFDLPAYTSGRRLQKEGVVAMSIRYTLNNIWMMRFGRPFTRAHVDHRPK